MNKRIHLVKVQIPFKARQNFDVTALPVDTMIFAWELFPSPGPGFEYIVLGFWVLEEIDRLNIQEPYPARQFHLFIEGDTLETESSHPRFIGADLKEPHRFLFET